MKTENSIDISIFGSCVTRDAIEFEQDENQRLELKTYIARQSIISALDKPIKCLEKDIKLDSPFQRRMVLGDLQKSTFELLRNDKSSYLIIDLIDERLGLRKLGGSVVTCSTEFEKSGVAEYFGGCEAVGIKFNNGDYLFENISLKQYCKRFCEQLLEIYPEEKIIIHRALGVTKYYDKNGDIQSFSSNDIKRCWDINRKLNYMYNELERLMPNAHVIRPLNKFIGDENHKWGRSIVHYEKAYYYYIVESLREITTN